MKKLFIVAILLTLTSCTSIRVQSLNPDVHKIHHVCIEENPSVIVQGFPNVIQKGFERHGITTELYSGIMPQYCECKLNYSANQTWDMAVYLTHAELSLYMDNERIAYAEYHLNGQGGLALNKWGSVESKMNPVIDELLSGYSPEVVDAYREPIIDDSSTELKDETTEKLRQLKKWYDEGLITDEEYKDQKQQIINQ